MTSAAAGRPRVVGVAAYAAALVVYVVAGYFFQGVVLNWIVGPLFLLIVGHVLPATGRAVWAKLARRRATRGRAR